jgi:hypothetical protein
MTFLMSMVLISMHTDSFKVGDLVIIKQVVRNTFKHTNPYCNNICEIARIDEEYFHLSPITDKPQGPGGFFHGSVIHIGLANAEDLKGIQNLHILGDLKFDNQEFETYLPLLEQYPE